METLKYKVIKTKSQYNMYCKALENFLEQEDQKPFEDEIDLLTLLIEKWDMEHDTFNGPDPVALLHSFMTDHDMKPKDLVLLLGISKGYVSEILHYKKGLSKDVIRKLSAHFKVSQEAFNRPYQLKNTDGPGKKGRAVKRKRKKTIAA